jgi:2'-5' RNA ligase
LHFLGEVTPQDDKAIRQALARLEASAFKIIIKGVGRFPPQGEPRVLWAGVEPDPPLLGLRNSIGTALTAAMGFQPEARPYSPHVTLARLDLAVPPAVIEHYLEGHKCFHVPPVLVRQFTLYSSTLDNDVPLYQEMAHFHLAEPGLPT